MNNNYYWSLIVASKKKLPPIWVEYIVARAVDFSLPVYNTMQENIVADTDHLASVQLYDSDNELVANLRPCLSTEKGHYLEGCLYDVVKKKFYYSQNAGVKYGDIVREVEYIKSTGTQVIDTGFIPNNNSRIESKCYRTGSGCWLYGASVANPCVTLYHSYTGNCRWGNQIMRNVGLVENTEYTIIENKNGLTLNGTLYPWTSGTAGDFTCDRSLTIGNCNGSTGTPYFTGKFYYMKIYDNDVLVLDLISCKDPNGVVCMYDFISGRFFTNAGTGEFVAGKDMNDLFNVVEKEGVFLNRTTGDGLNVKDKSLAHITSLKGNTLVWNQMVNNGDFKNGISNFKAENATIRITEEGVCVIQGSTLTGGFLYLNFKYTDHKYYISTVCRSDENNPVQCGICFLYDLGVRDNPVVYNYKDTAFKRCSTVGYLNKGNINRLSLRVGDSSTSGKNAFGIFKTFVCIDLTKMFGAGNEPETAEEFEAMFPADYYDYDAGSLLNVNAGGMKSTNVEKTKWDSLYFVDDVHTLSSLTGKAEGSSVSEVIFPEGMKRVGNVYDELTDVKDGCFTKAVKRIGSVDLCSLNWRGTTANKVYASSDINGIKNNRQHGDTQANILTLRYDNSPTVIYSQEMNDRQITINAGSFLQVVIRDDRYSNTTEFTESVQGVILLYELNTPIVYTLDTPVPCNYKVWKGGSEIVAPENTEALTAPVDMSVKYIVEEDE